MAIGMEYNTNDCRELTILIKLVYEFLSTLEPASSWLDFVSVVHEVGIQESNASAVQGTG